MTSLLLTVLVLLVAFLVQRWSPLVSGLVAVVPVKILATASMAYEAGPETLRSAIGGMLIGQFVWGFALLSVWLWLRY